MSFPENLGNGQFTITPDDNTDLPKGSSKIAVFVTVAGDVSVISSNGDGPVTWPMAAGSFIPVNVKRVRATGTTATGLIGVYR